MQNVLRWTTLVGFLAMAAGCFWTGKGKSDPAPDGRAYMSPAARMQPSRGYESSFKGGTRYEPKWRAP
jgi:hypothetical protein